MIFTALLVALIVFLAAMLRGFTGFGFALAAVPLLSMILPPARAVPIVVLLGAIVSLSDLRGNWHECDWRSMRWIVGGLVAGTPLGIQLLTNLPADQVRLAIGVLIAASVVLLGAGLRLPERPPVLLALGVGAVSGIVKGLAAMPGPPIVAYFLALPQAHKIARPSIIIAFSATGLLGLTGLLLRGLIHVDMILLSLTGLPSLLIGSRIGAIGFRRSSPRVHRLVALIVLGLLAAMLIGRALVK